MIPHLFISSKHNVSHAIPKHVTNCVDYFFSTLDVTVFQLNQLAGGCFQTIDLRVLLSIMSLGHTKSSSSKGLYFIIMERFWNYIIYHLIIAAGLGGRFRNHTIPVSPIGLKKVNFFFSRGLPHNLWYQFLWI